MSNSNILDSQEFDPISQNLLWLRLVYLIVNKILRLVIADYGTYHALLQCSRKLQDLECKKSLNFDS